MTTQPTPSWMITFNRFLWWLVGALAILMTIVWYAFFVRPLVAQGSVIRMFVEKNKYEALGTARAQQREIEAVLQEFRQFSSQDLTVVGELLPDEQQIPQLILQLDTMAQEAGLVMGAVAFSYPPPAKQAVAEASRVESVIITVTMEGKDYTALKQFVTLVERNFRLLDINGLQYAPDGDGFTITMTTYYFVPAL